MCRQVGAGRESIPAPRECQQLHEQPVVGPLGLAIFEPALFSEVGGLESRPADGTLCF
jgi:hypothetical protein